MLKKLAILLIFILGLNVPLIAQEDTSNLSSRQKIRKAIKEKLMNKLEINEETADKFMNLYNEQVKVVKEFNKERKDLMKSIEDNPGAPDVMTKINDLITIEDKITKSKKDFIADLQKFLSPKQIAQVLIFQKNLKNIFFEGKKRGKDKRKDKQMFY